ncbi:16S rRNA (cytosine(1402)-N(4))-methyltransferase, partial [Alkalihalophilus pseudofirmus]
MFEHTTVLLEEAVNGLNIKSDGIYVDCTLGGAGHSSHILSKLSAGGKLFAFDQDESAIAYASEKLSPYGNRFEII